MPRTLLLSIPLLLTLALLIAVAATYGSANSQASANGEYDADGDGLIEVEYLEQLDAIRYDLDGDGEADDDSSIDAYAAAFPGTVCNNNCNGYELARPLDFAAADSYASGAVSEEWTTGEGWQPIQSGEIWILVAENPFAATFDGNGHTISNLYVNRRPDNPEDSAPAGLFGSASDSIIRNVGLVDADVSGLAIVGGLAGWTDFSSDISGSHFSGTVTAGETDGAAVGGLVGYQDGVISDSYATGSVLGDEYVGGLAGENRGYIVASYSSAEVTGNGGVGGLAGVNRGLISGSYATGSVTGGSAVGGLAGYNGAVGGIIASYAAGAVTGDEGAGGLAGENMGDITASYATGEVSGNENVGGLAGRNMDEAGITASYATGRVSAGDNAGGLIGLDAANVTGAVWDTETSGIGNGVGRGDSEGVTGQTTVELQAAAGYSGVYRDWEIYVEEGLYRDPVEAPGPYDFWDFGTSGQYPALQAYLGVGGVTDWWESGAQPRAARPPAPTPAPVGAVSPALVAYDSDGDGLIEVSNLEQLDAIRYDLDGDGIPEDAAKAEYAAAYPVSGGEMVCNNCSGYELARPLDFAAADSYASGAVNGAWTTGAGWRPIGDSWHPFAATFNGNGHAVSNLYITPTTQADSSSVDGFGLFGSVGESGVIRETGLLNANVGGGDFVGPLAGANRGTVSHSYATGSVSGYGCVGGLVGSNDYGVISSSYAAVSVLGGYKYLGGLAGCNNGGTIIASYATGSVSGDILVGGLVGDNSGSVTASYATGTVRGQKYVGGLVGNNDDDGQISASYSASEVTAGHYIGGLAGGNEGMVGHGYAVGKLSSDGSIDAPLRYIGGLVGYNPGIIDSGLWDTETSGQQVGIGIEIGDGRSLDIFGKTTAELQSPIGYTGPYQGWDVSLFIEGAENTPDHTLSDFWDFGTSGQYPALKVDFDGDGTATWQEFGDQPREAPGPAPAPVVDNCVKTMTTAVVSAAWSGNCASGSRPGSHARFYTFTLTEPSEVIIDLESGDTDTYLYLLQGAGRTGEVLGGQGSSSRSSRIEDMLGAGTYTVEVTNYGSTQAGTFTLTVNGLATPPPPPLHTPAPIPTATPLPTPTPTRVPTSTPAPVEPTNTPAPTATPLPTPTPTRVPTSTPAPVEPTNTPAPTATAIAAQEPTPASDSGGACSYPDGDAPTGAAASSMFLLAAPLAMIGGLKFRARRRRGGAGAGD